VNGVWLDFGGPRFMVRRAGGANRKFNAVFSEVMRPHRRAMALGTMGEELSNSLLVKVYFEAVLVGWEHVKNAEGEILEFNEANFTKLMLDLPDLWDLIRSEASDL